MYAIIISAHRVAETVAKGHAPYCRFSNGNATLKEKKLLGEGMLLPKPSLKGGFK